MNISIDQVHVFLTVAERGSFSAAARALSRTQSAVTYTIQKLEAEIGTELFDRTAYRPALSDAGRSLLPYARRIAEDVGQFGAQAHSIAGGLESELALAVDSMFPMPLLLGALKDFEEKFPTVQPHLYVENLGSTAKLVLDGVCAAGLAVTFVTDPSALRRIALTSVELEMVAAPKHALARYRGPITKESLRDHVQLVLSDRSGLTGNRDYGVYATRTWRVADLGAKHAMLRAGLGFGSMPNHMIEKDLKAGNLVRLVIDLADTAAANAILPICAIHLLSQPIGPATQWMIKNLVRLTRKPADGSA
jgi:DNA-binding transcriptional LysR family regulator